MVMKRNTPLVAALIALLLVIIAVAIGWRLLNGDSSLLRNVSVDDAAISPNADGEQDATLLRYELSRNADVSIYLENEVGERYLLPARKAPRRWRI